MLQGEFNHSITVHDEFRIPDEDSSEALLLSIDTKLKS